MPFLDWKVKIQNLSRSFKGIEFVILNSVF